ncbi:trigger factor [Sulfurimonas sp. MAG313]|nr:trigger factor [Sulfurimonas sp. MAG313]MDF1881597.1 trigger factor [Sulfurimonas sp. MAG313]
MEFKTNKIDGANAEITATLAQTDIDANVEKIAKQLAKTTDVPGFRKGKVPVTAVKKQYGEKLVQDAESEALRDLLEVGLKELGLDNDALIGEPQITKFDKNDGKIEVAVTIALRPEINLDGYADIAPEATKPKVGAKAITDRIQEMAQAQAEFIDVEEDRALVDGDTANLNFEGSIDGELFEGGAAEDFSLTLGSNQFIPGFEDQVIGMKKGDDKVVKVTFPENYGGEKLAGKDAEFKVKINSIQEKAKIRMDAALAKKMMPGDEEASMDKLKDQIKEQIEKEELSKLYNDELKPSLLEAFVEKFNFDLPKFVVEQEIDMALNKKAQEMSEDEINELKDNQDKVTELRETFRADAAKSVKATFIIDALAKKEGVEVEENEVMQTIYFEAMQTGQDPAGVYENYKKAGYLPAIQMAMVEDKVLTKIIDAKLK